MRLLNLTNYKLLIAHRFRIRDFDFPALLIPALLIVDKGQ